MFNTRNNPRGIVQRGYVLVRRGKKPSAILQRGEITQLQARFGGRIVSAKGLAYRTAQGFRVVADPSQLEEAGR